MLNSGHRSIFGMGGFQLSHPRERVNAGSGQLVMKAMRGVCCRCLREGTNRPGCVTPHSGRASPADHGLVESLNAGLPQSPSQACQLRACLEERGRKPASSTCCDLWSRSHSRQVIKRIPEPPARFAMATCGRRGRSWSTYGGHRACRPRLRRRRLLDRSRHDQGAGAARCRIGRRRRRAARLLAPDRQCTSPAEVHISDYAAGSLAAAHGIPVAHTMSGKGAIACDDALSAGLFGRYDRIANAMLAESDCLLVVGCKLGEIATKRFSLIPPGKTVIHIDIEATEIGRTTRTEVALVGDAGLALEDLSAALGDGKRRLAARASWLAQVPRRMAAWRESARDRLESKERPINVGRLMGELNKAMPADGIVVADGGFAAHWAGLLFDTKAAGRHFVPDRGFASIG